MNGLAPALPLPLATGHEATLEGKVKKIVYDSPDGRMRVFEIELDDKTIETIRQFDNIHPINKNDQIRILGKVVMHKRWGRQFQARDVLKRIPTSAAGVAKILAGKEFKGIGPKLAEKIANNLGPDLISILNRGDPGELLTDLIGEKKAKALLSAWGEKMPEHAAHAMLAELGVGPEIRKKIIATIPDFEAVLQTDPYRISKEVEGVGFLTADALAQRAGTFRADSPKRLASGILYALELGQQDGHTGLSYAQLLDKACEALTFGNRQALSAILDQEIKNGSLQKSPNNLIQRPQVARTEALLAQNIVRLARAELKMFNPVQVMRVLSRIKEAHGLNDLQFEAVSAALTNALSVVTGGPGTGKTRTITAIIDAYKKLCLDIGQMPRILLIAPTGKAADRAHESTGHEASTIHMALGYNAEGGGFLHNDQDPLPYDLIIADEYSMVDTRLANSLLRAIGDATLIIVGDVDQLPSVDAGRVLNDIIESGICHVTRFSRVYRTGEGSDIAVGAAKIREGGMPEFGEPGKSDLVFIEMKELDETANRIGQMIAEKLPKFTGSPQNQIQLLSPGKNSQVGVHALNARLQAAINPNPPMCVGANDNDRVVIRNGHQIREGDRVICMKTNRELNVFNGDVGTVIGCDIDSENNATLLIQIGKKDVLIDRSYWNNLDLAYAMTIHKSQGSEYDVVVIPMTTSHYMMLKRNLLYTAITRAKKLCVIIGTKRALQRAINTLDGTSRQTGLLSRIRAFG
jgi:exodeoxyribonuclease V alpha subunit